MPNLNQMNPTTFLVIIVYMIVIAVMGVVIGKRKIKTSDDFNNAGQGLDWKLIAGSGISTAMGVSTVIGKYDVIHESGLSGVTASLFWWVGWLVIILLAKHLRRFGVNSIPAFLANRYNAATRKICSVCVMVTMMSTLAGNFLGVGTILEALDICDRTTGTWIGALVIVLFTVFGGLWSVAITDTVQAVIIIVGFGVIFPLSVFHTAGGWSAVAAVNTAERLNFFTGIAPITIVGWIVSYILSAGAGPAFAQRIFTAKSDKDAIKGQLIAWSVSLLFGGIICALPALAIGRIYPDLTVGSEFTPMYIAQYFSPVFGGVLLATLFAMLLTTGDSYLLILSGTVVDDIIKVKKPELDNRQSLLCSRVICVVGAAAICVMALYVGSIYQLVKTGSGAYGAGVFIPMFLGCFWKKAHAKAINAAMLVGCMTSFLFDMFLKIPLGLDIDGVIIGAVLCIVICVAGSLLAGQKEASAPPL